MQWRTVTWYSKLLAMALFVALPFIGFYLGARYGRETQSLDDFNNTPGASSVASGDWKTYVNRTYGFSFSYPKEFVPIEGDATPTAAWRIDGVPGDSGIDAVNVTIPQSFESKTNFGDATFHVGVSRERAALATCRAPQGGMATGPISTAVRTIGDVPVVMFTTDGAGAGNRYTTSAYRALRNGMCFAIDLTIHSTVLENYPPELGYKAFDRERVETVLQKMFASFNFK